eukprot:GILK01006519.1.p1 GENE.GILK01006519.1~~GILK01006519.1.p1  ORF type:complete len:272 (-),score=37.57 GILK01006519.1:165-980(-)
MSSDDEVCTDAVIREFTYGEIVIKAKCYESWRGNILSHDTDLTGFMIWPGTHLLAHYLARNKDRFTNAKILEVGSGMGVTGLIAGHFGQRTVLTDREDTVLALLEENIQLNNLQQTISVFLEWGTEVEGFVDRNGRFDVVMGADIIYPTTQTTVMQMLFDTVKILLSPLASAYFLCSYVPRVRETTKTFLTLAHSNGLDCEILPTDDISADEPLTKGTYLFKFTIPTNGGPQNWLEGEVFQSLIVPPRRNSSSSEGEWVPPAEDGLFDENI